MSIVINVINRSGFDFIRVSRAFWRHVPERLLNRKSLRAIVGEHGEKGTVEPRRSNGMLGFSRPGNNLEALLFIHQNGGVTPMESLAEFLGGKTVSSKVVSQLEGTLPDKAGPAPDALVTRNVNPLDQRRLLISLTDAGKELVEKIIGRVLSPDQVDARDGRVPIVNAVDVLDWVQGRPARVIDWIEHDGKVKGRNVSSDFFAIYIDDYAGEKTGRFIMIDPKKISGDVLVADCANLDKVELSWRHKAFYEDGQDWLDIGSDSDEHEDIMSFDEAEREGLRILGEVIVESIKE